MAITWVVAGSSKRYWGYYEKCEAPREICSTYPLTVLKFISIGNALAGIGSSMDIEYF